MPPDHVAVDSSTPVNDSRLYHIGIAIEVEDETKFKNYYFEVMEEFVRKYDIHLAYPVMKGDTLGNLLPSYKYTDAISELSDKLVKNPAISRMHLSVGWYDEPVNLPPSDKEVSGINFLKDNVGQYFPLLVLWRYHRKNRKNLPSTVYLDNISGKITKAWKYVGMQFDDLYLVPNGDITYPSISTADILSYSLGSMMPNDLSFDETREQAGSWLINNKNQDVDPYVSDDSITPEHADHIVPEYVYPIKSELHYPHPIVFILDERLKSRSCDITKTGIHGIARKYAYLNRGSVTKVHAPDLPHSIRDGDVILHTYGSDDDLAQLYSHIDPTTDIRVVPSTEAQASLFTRERE